MWVLEIAYRIMPKPIETDEFLSKFSIPAFECKYVGGLGDLKLVFRDFCDNYPIMFGEENDKFSKFEGNYTIQRYESGQ